MAQSPGIGLPPLLSYEESQALIEEQTADLPFTWEEVRGRDDFNALEPAIQENVKRDYYESYISPRGLTWEQFQEQSSPSIADRVGGAFQGLAGQYQESAALGAAKMGFPEEAASLRSSAAENQAQAQQTAVGELKYKESGWEQALNIFTGDFWTQMFTEALPQTLPILAAGGVGAYAGFKTGAIGGALAGTAVAPGVGTAVGAGVGAAAGTIFGAMVGVAGASFAQSIGPAYQFFLSKNPDDEDGAVDYALKQAGLTSAFEAMAVPLGVFGYGMGLIKHAFVQMAVQAVHGGSSAVLENVIAQEVDPTIPWSRGIAQEAMAEAFFESVPVTVAVRTGFKAAKNAKKGKAAPDGVSYADEVELGFPNEPNPDQNATPLPAPPERLGLPLPVSETINQPATQSGLYKQIEAPPGTPPYGATPTPAPHPGREPTELEAGPAYPPISQEGPVEAPPGPPPLPGSPESLMTPERAKEILATHRQRNADRRAEREAEKPPVEIEAEPVEESGSFEGEPKIDEAIGDRILTHPKLFGDSPNAESLKAQGFKSLSRDAQQMVLSQMRTSINNQEIVGSIIKAVPVDVMNSLIGPEGAAEDLLHNPSVLTHRLSVPGNVPIPESVISFVDALSTAIKPRAADTVAKESGLRSGPGSIELAGRKGSAVQAVGGDLWHGVIAGQEVEVELNPSEAQKQAGNYSKGAIRLHGLEITIENPAGSTRSGVNKAGKAWETTMVHHYGYVKRTEGADGDQVDVFIGPDEKSDRVFVVDQVDPETGKFDEHKAMLGFSTEDEAAEGYLANYDEGWKGLGAISRMDVSDFQGWLKEGDTTKPLALPEEGVETPPESAQAPAQAAEPETETTTTPEPGKTAETPKLEPGTEKFLEGVEKKDLTVRGSPGKATTEQGQEVGFDYAVVEAEDLVASHDAKGTPNPNYPKELQPRQRGRTGLALQVTRMASQLKPELLGPSPLASQGAPIVGEDLVIESGNGRVAAIRQAYENEKAGEYRSAISADSETYGLAADVIDAMDEPVIVRVRTTEMDEAQRAEFTKQANESALASMSAAETAEQDATRLSLDLLVPTENGQIDTPANAQFIKYFLEDVVPPNEQTGLLDPKGNLSQDGIRRVKNAVFARGYGSSDTVLRMTESTDSNVRNITNGMLMAAPKIAKMKDAILAGKLHPLDITEKFALAVEEFSALRRQGMKIENVLSQTDLLGAPWDSLTLEILQNIEKLGRSGKRIGNFLNTYADMVEDLGSPQQESLLDDNDIPTKKETLEAAARRTAAEAEDAPLLEGISDDEGVGERGKSEPATETSAGKGAETAEGGGAESVVVKTKVPTPQIKEGAGGATPLGMKPALPDIGHENTVVTREEAQKIQDEIADDLGKKRHAGIDPETMVKTGKLAAFYIEAGVRKFADFSKYMLDALGKGIKRYLGGAFIRGKRTLGREARKSGPKPLPSSSPAVHPTLGKNPWIKSSQPKQTPTTPAKPKETTALAKLQKPVTLADKVLSIPWRIGGQNYWAQGIDLIENVIEARLPEKFKAGFYDRYGQHPDQAVGEARHKAAIRKGARGILKIAKKLALTPEQTVVVYEWFQEKPNTAREKYLIDQLNPDEQKTVREIKAQIRIMGLELVRLGLLSQAAFERNENAYVHRTYRQYELTEKGEITKARKKSIRIVGEELMGRGHSIIYERARLMKDASKEWVAHRLGKDAGSLLGEKFIRFNAIDKNGDLNRMAYVHKDFPVPSKFTDPNTSWVADMDAETGEINYWKAQWMDKVSGEPIMWRDLTKSERKEKGEILDAQYAVARTLMHMMRDIATGQYFEWMVNHRDSEGNPDWVVDDESQIPEGDTVAQGVGSQWRAYLPNEWVQVPNTRIRKTGGVPKFGALADKYIKGPLWNDVRNVAEYDTGFLAPWWNRLMRTFKISKTALNPAVHVNNVAANVVLADWNNISRRNMLRSLNTYFQAWKGDERARGLLDRADDAGSFFGGYAAAELQRQIMEPLEAQLAQQVKEDAADSDAGNMHKMAETMALLEPLWDKAVWVKDKAIDLYQFEDNVFRMAAFLQALDDGKTDTEAGTIAREDFLNYDINAPYINFLRATGLPFLSFSYRAGPKIENTVKTAPWKMLKLALFVAGMNALGQALSGGDDEQERAFLPRGKYEKIFGLFPRIIRMPFNSDGHPVFLDITRWIPMGDMTFFDESPSVFPIPPMMILGGPVQWLMELAMNKSSFTRRDIYPANATPAERAGAGFLHIYRGLTPNLIIVPRSYGWDKLGYPGGDRFQKDPFGREYPTLLAYMNAFGLKLAAYPLDVMKMAYAKNQDRKIALLKSRLTDIGKGLVRAKTNASTDKLVNELVYVRDQIEKIVTETRERSEAWERGAERKRRRNPLKRKSQ